MKKAISILFILHSSFFTAHAQDTLFKHVYWQAYGSRGGEAFGFNGLDTIGYVNDTIQHALSIGEDAGAAFVLNRKPLDSLRPDTAPVYRFPGQKVIRCNLNGDAYPDFVIHDATARKITVLFGTDIINKFDTALVLQGDTNKNEFGDYTSIAVANFDTGAYNGIVISDPVYTEDQGHTDIGRILYYSGGISLNSMPSQEIKGLSNESWVGGKLTVGHVLNSTNKYLAELRSLNALTKNDTFGVVLYPLGASFNITKPADTVILVTDSAGKPSGGFALADVNGDGIDDILLGGTVGNVLVYYGGASISPYPTFIFHRPFDTQSPAFGSKIVDVGDVTGNGYHSLLVTDPQAYIDDGGAVFLYNMGKALKDTCVAFADMPPGSFAQFGTQAIGIGDNLGNGRTEFAVGGDETDPDHPFHSGQLFAFLGESSYGPMVGVREDGTIPKVFTLAQNYPNPVSGETTITFSVLDPRLYGAEATVTLYNSLGTKVATIYRGRADAYGYTLGFDASALPAGNYYYRLECGGREETKMLSILK